MKILVIGSGGREHAMAWRICQTPGVTKVFVAPGNGGTALEAKMENVPISDLTELADFAAKEQVHLTVVGPEAPLAAGWLTCSASAACVFLAQPNLQPNWKARRTTPRPS